MKRDTRSAYRARAAATERSIDEAAAEVKAAKEVESAKLAAIYAERNKFVPYDSNELHAARAIRTTGGWHKVVRVNRKSVSVESGYSWTDRIAIDKILEVRT